MAKRQTTIKEIKTALKLQGFNRRERRRYIRALRKEAKMDEREFIHPEEETDETQKDSDTSS